MAITFTAVRSVPKSAKATISLVTVEQVGDGVEGVSAAQLKQAQFEGKAGQVFVAHADKQTQVLIGLGDQGDVSTTSLRAAGAAIGRQFGSYASVGVDLGTLELDGREARQALVEGIALSTYSFGAYKSDAKPSKLKTVSIAGGAGAKNQQAIEDAASVARGQMLARDLVNEPGGTLTPAVFARRCEKMAKEQGLTAKVWDLAAIKKAKLGGLLGVNRGSDNPARFVELTYKPKGKSTGTLALVGKGVTFDSGGISIKPGQGPITWMKSDMGGAAAVVGAMSVLQDLNVPCQVKAFLPMTDNMLGGDATRPGDVLTLRNGKTIEVLNTDAEGRLILADALCLASEAKPDAIIDLATLTGACMVALGPKIAGLMGNDDDLVASIEASSKATDEKVWHLPLPAEYRKHVDSPIADLKNIGIPYGGALTAGLILQEFVADGIPWAHIDIAGPSWSEGDDAEVLKGGTGFGVRLIADVAKNFSR